MQTNRGEPMESAVARTIKRGFPTLRFEPALEREFLSQHHEAIRVRVRIAVCLALATVLGFAMLDRWLLGYSSGGALGLIRFGIHLPLVLGCLALTPLALALSYPTQSKPTRGTPINHGSQRW